MREAISGYLNYTILFLFVLLVSGFIAVSINYTKAYRMKNGLLETIEKYEGNMSNDNMLDEIASGANRIGYKYIADGDYGDYKCVVDQGWCYKKNSKYKIKTGDISYFTVDVIVFINWDIPVVNRIIPGKFRIMSGTTNAIPDLN